MNEYFKDCDIIGSRAYLWPRKAPEGVQTLSKVANVVPKRYQTFWRRVWAGWVDILVFAPVAIFDHVFWTLSTPIFVRTGWILIHALLFYGYSVLAHGLYGQTLGKRVCGIRVLDVREKPLGLARAFLRDFPMIGLTLWQLGANLTPILNGIRQTPRKGEGFGIVGWVTIVWGVLELLTIFANSRRRALHDLIAGSVVVRIDRSPNSEPTH